MAASELSFTIKDSKVFLPSAEVDQETLQQINMMVDQPTTNHARFMPDCHKGSGCCIGFTNLIINGIVPNYVGGDIGCGILSYNSGIVLREKKYPKIEQTIRLMVPVGEKVHDKPIVDDLENIFVKSNVHLENLKRIYPDLEDFKYDDEYFLNSMQKNKM